LPGLGWLARVPVQVPSATAVTVTHMASG
jgi:hypothetical protein